MKTLLLIDGSNFFYRAYYALPALNTSDGTPTNAVRGFVSMLESLRREVPTDYIACVFDPKGPTFRSEIFPDYKATREEMPDDLRTQIPLIFEAVRLLGIPELQISGIEADDTIGTLARQAVSQDFDVVIATGDKDFAQLVNDRTRLINTMVKDKMWTDASGVVDKFGVPPSQIIDYLALRGDKVDNVPGIPNCGEVTAAKLLREYGSVENIIASAGSIKGRIGNNIRENIGFLPVAKTLVTIKTDADISSDVPSLETLRQKEIDKRKLLDFYTRLEFRSWAAKLRKESGLAAAKPAPKPAPQENAEQDLFAGIEDAPEPVDAEEEDPVIEPQAAVIVDKATMQSVSEEFARRSAQGQTASIYIISDSDEQQEMLPVGMAVYYDDKSIWYIPVSSGSLLSDEIDPATFKDGFGRWLADPKAVKHVYDAKRSAHILANAGMRLDGAAGDVLLQNYVLEAHRSHALEKISANWLQYELKTEADLLGKGVKKKTFPQLSHEECADFAGKRACMVANLSRIFSKALREQPELENVYRGIELPVSRVLFRMEQNGVLIDSRKLDVQTAELNREVEKVCEQAYLVAGETFNLGSPKKLGEILFDKMGALVGGKKPKKTATGNFSTSEEVLSELAFDYPLAKLALEYRALAKLISTYTEKLPKLVSPKDGRIHTTFEQAVAVTGRLSSTNPNLQNIPVRTPEGRRVREAFVAPEGCRIVSADYSQIELRIMAHISNDAGFINAFRHNQDIHKATAAEVFKESLGDVTGEQRRIAKVINFGLIYGMSAFGLARNLGIDRQEAKNYISRYFERYPGVSSYMELTRELALRQGYVKTLFGRKLELPDLKVPGARRNAAERQAINAPMQGTAADLIKMAMIAVQDWLDKENLRSKLILQVHDELIIEAPDDEAELVMRKLPEIMSSVATLHVPLVAEVGEGDSWEAAH